MARGCVRLMMAAALLAVVLGGAAPASAQGSGWSWHLSAGAVSEQGVGFTGMVWAGSPAFDELFLRAGLSAGGSTTRAEAGIAYVLTPVAPSLAARFPDLDPFLSFAMTFDASTSSTGAYGGVGATFRIAGRTWAWGEVRLGSRSALVVGLGVSL